MAKNIVIIPTYNERENVEAIIRKVMSLEMPFDILIVDPLSSEALRDHLLTRSYHSMR